MSINIVQDIQEDHQKRSPAGAPGYYETVLDHGSFPVGRPWGQPCQAEIVYLDPAFPPQMVDEANRVVAGARVGGLNVTLGSAAPGQPAEAQPSTQPVPIAIRRVAREPHLHQEYSTSLLANWRTAADADGTHRDLTWFQGSLFTDATHDKPVAVRKALRVILARSVGLVSSDREGSGLMWEFDDSADEFSPMDLRALRIFSGCGPP